MPLLPSPRPPLPSIFYRGLTDCFSLPLSPLPPLSPQVVSTEAMDELADWPTRNEDFRFDPLDPSDLTWHR